MFTFGTMMWLMALPLPFALWWLAQRGNIPHPRAQTALFHPHTAVLAALAAEHKTRAPWPWLAGCALLIVALARPQWIAFDPGAQPGRDLLFAVDISGSMRTEDFARNGQPQSRLDAVKHALSAVLEQRRGDRAGLIVFGDDAYTLSPVTHDLTLVRQLLSEIRPGLAGERTALGTAVALAVQRLRERPPAARTLVLFTDGAQTAGDIAPGAALALAKRHQVRIHTVGLGAADVSRGNESAPLDEALLQQLALETGGRYFRIADDKAMDALAAALDDIEAQTFQSGARGTPEEWFWLPLLAGLALLASGEWRRAARVTPA